jgi:hypothetical protein
MSIQNFKVKGNKHINGFTMTRAQVERTRDLLIQVLPRIKKCNTSFICLQLNHLSDDFNEDPDIDRAKRYVMTSLNYQNKGDCQIPTVTTWLGYRNERMDYSFVRNTRVQFLKNMIAELNRALSL